MRISDCARRNLLLVTLTSAIVAGASLLVLLQLGAYPTPFSDEFYFHTLYQNASQGELKIQDIFEPHFGHIYVLLKCWLWLVVYYGIDWRASMYVQVVFIAIIAGLLSRIAAARISSSFNKIAVIAVTCIVCSARQAENLYWAIQLSAAAMFFFTIAAFYFVDRFNKTKEIKYASLAFLFALLALLSNGGGIASFFIVVAVLWLSAAEKFGLKLILFFIGLIAFLGLGCLHAAGSEVGAGVSLLSVKTLLIYVLAFFSNALFSFSERGDDFPSLSLGGIVLSLTIFLVASSWRDKQKHLFPYLLILFSILSCVIIACVRLKGGIFQPNASRYYPFASAVLVGDLLLLCRMEETNKTFRVLFVSLSFMIVLSYLFSYFGEVKISPHRYINSRNSHVNLCDGRDVGLAFGGDLRYTNTNVLRGIFCSDIDKVFLENNKNSALIEFGPVETVRGQAFNTQKNGQSAIWARTENCAAGTCRLMFGGKSISFTSNNDGTLVTAIIPKELYQSAGEKMVYVENITSGKKSKSLKFLVY